MQNSSSCSWKTRIAPILWIVLISFCLAVSSPDQANLQDPPPPSTTSPARNIGLGNWTNKPSIPPEGSPQVNQDQLRAQQYVIECHEWTDRGRANLAVRMTYSRITYNTPNWEIVLHSLCRDGEFIQITNNTATDFSPRMNQDASLVVYVSDRDGNEEIYSYDVIGSTTIRLTTDPSSDAMPTISPDESSVAFVSDRSGYPEIYSMPLTGGQSSALTHHRMISLNPEWSPDGTQIAYSRGNGSFGQIILMDRNGSNQHAISGYLPLLGKIRWSPDGNRLGFEYDANHDGWIDLGIINSDGSGLQTKLLTTPGNDFEIGGWTPDGWWFVYDHLRYLFSERDGKWYLSNTWMRYLGQDGETYDDHFDVYRLNPNIGTIDNSAPTSWIDYSPGEQIPGWVEAGKAYKFLISLIDNGRSGIYKTYLEVSNDDGASWDQYFSINGSPISEYRYFSKTEEAGLVISLRASAEDNAGNIEVPHIAPDQVFGVYKSMASGVVSDIREHPLNAVGLHISPSAMNTPQTNLNGHVNVFFGSNGTYQVDFSKPGMGTIPSQTWEINAGKEFSTFLPGIDDRVSNGNFTSPVPLTDWLIEGPRTVGVTSGLEGGNAADFSCSSNRSLCLSPAEEIAQTEVFGELVTDSQGINHVVTGDGNYYTRSLEGMWSKIAYLPTSGAYSGLVIGQDDSLYVINNNRPSIYRKAPGESWSILADLPLTAKGIAIQIDINRTVHIVYIESNTLQYVTLPTDGSLGVPRAIINGLYLINQPSFVVLSDGTLHILYRNTVAALGFVTILPNGEIIPPVTLKCNETAINHPKLVYGPDGTLHVIAHLEYTNWSGSTSTYLLNYIYWSRSPEGLWKSERLPFGTDKFDSTKPTLVPWAGISVDQNNDVQILLVNRKGTTLSLVYLSRPDPTQPWIKREISEASQPSFLNFSINGFGRSHALTGDGEHLLYRSLDFAVRDEITTMSQEIFIPTSMHEPTLSFFVDTEEFITAKNTSFEVVIVEEGKDPVSILTIDRPTSNWKHFWADLSPWIGKTVQLHFKVNQAVNEYPPDLKIDAISVSSWTTPVMQSISPNLLEMVSDLGEWATLHGDNLMPGSQVFVGNFQISSVEFDADSRDLRILVPSQIPQGRYDVKVIPPDGPEGILQGALQIGIPNYLPLIKSWVR